MNPASFALPADQTAALTVSIRTTRATVNNVLAYLPGKTDEYVIIGAHYDHSPRQLRFARASQIGQIHPERRQRFRHRRSARTGAAFSSAKRSVAARNSLYVVRRRRARLLGSAEWVKNPTRPLDKAVAMLNMDMIGRIKDDKVYIGGVGTGSTLKAAVEQAAEKSGFQDRVFGQRYSSSDHTSFVTKKIPVLFFFLACTRLSQAFRYWEKIDP